MPGMSLSPSFAAHRSMVVRSLQQPYRVPAAMVLLMALVPLYILVPAFFPARARYVPELALDRALPLIPSWALVYGALYLFLILLPLLVVRQDELIRRTVHACLVAWVTSYLFFFVVYPTVAPRPPVVTGYGFGMWGLQVLYGADPPYNCFPSLHVAHSFVSAMAAGRVHRRLGAIALGCASLVAVSTLLTKQHYVVDVVAGVALAVMAGTLFLRPFDASRVPAFDRQVAPALAVCVAGVAAVGLALFWLAYLWGGETWFEVRS